MSQHDQQQQAIAAASYAAWWAAAQAQAAQDAQIEGLRAQLAAQYAAAGIK